MTGPLMSEDDQVFESLIRLDRYGASTGLIARTAEHGAWGGVFTHLFSADCADSDRDDAKRTWWALCTRANGSDTAPGWYAKLCPECKELGPFRMKVRDL